MTTQKAFARYAGEKAVLWIDPSRIDTTIGTKWPVGKRKIRQLRKYLHPSVSDLARPWFKHREPFCIPANSFGSPTAIISTKRYQRIAEFVHHSGNVRETLWYEMLMDELKKDGIARHKEIEMLCEDDIVAFLQGYARDLVSSILDYGFKPDFTGYESTALVGPDGTLHKSGSGNHRFYICKALGISKFPLRVVGAHAAWLVSAGLSADIASDATLEALQRVEANHN
ncbi:hypothetical protein [Tropicimonas sediminicola]|uniref:Uncharacterized protein n=1 Tax=Tropicimonas sediminicola TaxID=1031541 RepID=A0A239MDG7_9RHOB|nr:hypothetical protein [Tropicimonas sediminicola]SNT39869.1 hypothetical protein SAMN05421757_11548 [Tropicimonas sediminicola]